MRFTISILTVAAALTAGSALAQVPVAGSVGTQAEVGANANANAGGLLGGVTGALGRTVNSADSAINGTVNGLATAGLRLATRADLRAGAEVRDNRGRRIGTVAAVHGDTAMVVRGGQTVHVPLSALYRAGNGLVTSLSRAELNAAAAARAQGGARY